MVACRYSYAGPAVCAAVLLALSWGNSRTCWGMVACPRVTSEHTADTTDLTRFRQFSQWKDKRGNDLALAIWKYLCGYETGLYHFYEILESSDSFDEYATVREPLKILNVYNMGYCAIFGPVLDGIYQGVGFEGGRSFGLERWNHSATEIWYDGAWHYFDVDVRGVLLDETGTVVSLREAQQNRRLWTDPPKPIEPFFPKDGDKSRLFEIYHDSPVHYYYRGFQGSHAMDFCLRQGESFTRWWTPQGGRWHHLPRYSTTKWVRDLLMEEPAGMKPNHREFTRWNHGNGLFRYAPNLSAPSTDFRDGVCAARNLAAGRAGLHLVEAGDAEAIFEVFTPYIIVAKINNIDDPNDDAEASVVSVDAGLSVDLAVSGDHGRIWQHVGTVEGGAKEAVDLTRLVRGTYGYLLKLSTSGAKEEVAVKSLSIDTWVQVAPISLPRLKRGENHLRYEVSDRYGLKTVPMLVAPDSSNPKDLAKYLATMPEDYDAKRDTCRIRGDAVLRLAAPAGTRIAWFSVGATFRTHQGEQAARTDNRIAYAVGEPRDFMEIYRSSVPTWTNHWRCNWDTDVTLDRPAETVYVRFHGDPGLNTIRACLHLLPPEPAQTAVRVTHSFRIDGRLYDESFDLTEPADYTIHCDGDPENVAVTIAVPSNAD